MQAGADAKAERFCCVPNPACAVDRAGGPVERGERSITGRFDELAAEALDVRAEQLVVCLTDESPRGVAEGRRTFGRADDVGEEDGGEYTIGSAGSANAGHELFDL